MRNSFYPTPPPVPALLKGIFINNGLYPLRGNFNPNRDNSAYVPADVDTIDITPIADNERTNIKVNGVLLDEIGDSETVKLAEGQNCVLILQIDERNNITPYVLNIFRDSAVGFDTVIGFADAAEKFETSGGFSSFNSGVVNAHIAFAYDFIAVQTGAACVMTINVDGVNQLNVSFLSDYLNLPFLFTDTAGTTHEGTFINGTINF